MQQRTSYARILDFYDRACMRYAACVAELQRAAEQGEFEQQLAAATEAREHCVTARARAVAYLRNRRSGYRCRVYR